MTQRQAVSINFSQGLNTKTDPWQLPTGQFEELENSIFQKGGLLQKRDGYGVLTTNVPSDSAALTTLDGNLISIGSALEVYSQSLDTFISKGAISPCELSTLAIVRNNLNQTQVDQAIANGLTLTVYSELNNATTTYYYKISDQQTGQSVVSPTAITPLSTGTISGSSRAFVVGNYFLIVSYVIVSAVGHLQYISIPIGNPTSPSAPQNVTSENYVAISTNPGWDGVVTNNTLVVAYNSTTGAQGVHVATLTQFQIATNSASTIIHAFNNAAYIGALVGCGRDSSTNPETIWVSFWNNSTQNGYALAVSIGLGTIDVVLSPTQVITSKAVKNITITGLSGSGHVFYEVTNAYSYDPFVASDFINSVACTSSGSVGSTSTSCRSVGLASKACVLNGVIYYLALYVSPYQPTYFLINGSTSTSASPKIVSKLAYENGASSYYQLGLPAVTETDQNTINIPYLYRDLIEALTTAENSQQTVTGGIYSQTGINQVLFTIGTDISQIGTAEISGSLQYTGGYLSMFDGETSVEQNFFLWPDSVEVTGSGSGGSMAAGTYYYQATYEWSDNQGNIHRSAPSIPVTVTTSGATSSVTVNVPTLRLTEKISNPVKIVIYRWGSSQQTYHQVTSITAPKLNDTTADSVSFVDTQSDAQIQGNNILYTTGGVVENVNAPSSSIITLFDTRLWLVDAEDPNLLWVSKQVIENTPVEMSDLFTIYVAPNTGTVESTGPITALAPMDDKLIIFKENAIYYINGVGPNDQGQTSPGCSLGNYSQATFITAVVGCTNQQSIVLTQNGLMFQSDKGIWILGRNLETQYIGSPVERYNSSTVNSAKVIPGKNYVIFTLSTKEMLMYDYFYGQWGVFKGASSISSVLYNGLHTILTPFGEILQQTPGVYLDHSTPVSMRFKTGWLNLASLQGYERFYGFMLLARYLSPHRIQLEVAYDYVSSPVHYQLITPNNSRPKPPSAFGVPTPYSDQSDLEQWRVDAKQQLCESFQLTLSEVFDSSSGEGAGAGFTMSGITAVVGLKRATKPLRGAQSTGFQ